MVRYLNRAKTFLLLTLLSARRETFVIKWPNGETCFSSRCSAEAVTLNDCLQLSYLPSKRNHMLLLYPREILILDLELSQTVGVVAIERSGVPFTQVGSPRGISHAGAYWATPTQSVQSGDNKQTFVRFSCMFIKVQFRVRCHKVKGKVTVTDVYEQAIRHNVLGIMLMICQGVLTAQSSVFEKKKKKKHDVELGSENLRWRLSWSRWDKWKDSSASYISIFPLLKRTLCTVSTVYSIIHRALPTSLFFPWIILQEANSPCHEW